MPETADQSRLDWVDAAKGFCIIMVVLMHSTLGVEKELGQPNWLHALVDWARPFRMPDFFLISGLFLAARIERPWRVYLDSKVVHFVYFYVLWFNIHFALRLKGTIAEAGVDAALWHYLGGYIEPFGSLWFIYLLAVYFLVAKLLHGVPKVAVLAAGVVMHMLAPQSGSFLVDEFMGRFVFFYAGYAGAPVVFELARRISLLPVAVTAAAIGVWAVVNATAVATGASQWLGIDLVFSALGIAAVVAFSVLLTMPAPWRSVRPFIGAVLLYCGRNSIVIYLAFTIFMATTRTLLIKLAPGLDGGIVSLGASLAGLSGALVLNAVVSGTRAQFLFARPAWARLSAAGARRISRHASPARRAAAVRQVARAQ